MPASPGTAPRCAGGSPPAPQRAVHPHHHGGRACSTRPPEGPPPFARTGSGRSGRRWSPEIHKRQVPGGPSNARPRSRPLAFQRVRKIVSIRSRSHAHPRPAAFICLRIRGPYTSSKRPPPGTRDPLPAGRATRVTFSAGRTDPATRRRRPPHPPGLPGQFGSAQVHLPHQAAAGRSRPWPMLVAVNVCSWW